ncbi:MAG: hypothetical protein PHV13_01260 [Candidatus ainarchaeum sp.]|nr:hypothetical protein [Candidatus ainarchaeum sp.]
MNTKTVAGKTQAFVLKTLVTRSVKPTDTQVHRLSDLVHRCSLQSSGGGFDRLREGTETNLKNMGRRIRRARRFLSSAEKRMKRQHISPEVFIAETAEASTAISLYDSLRKMVETALKTTDQASLMLLNVATGVLSARFGEAILLEESYPQRSEILTAMVKQRISGALRLYNDIVSELGDVPQKLGIPLPKRPEQKRD